LKSIILQGKYANGQVMLVNDELYDDMVQYRWTATNPSRRKTQYARARINGKAIFAHRYILNPDSSQSVDHINGNGLDNRKCNLRICSHSQNMYNRSSDIGSSSKYKGVSFNRRHNVWNVAVYRNGICVFSSQFLREEYAARAYDVYARIYFGDYARLNFLNEHYDEEWVRDNKYVAQGTSKYKGVCQNKDGRWAAYVQINKKRIYLGTYNDEISAAYAHDRYILQNDGDISRLNFPDQRALNTEISDKRTFKRGYGGYKGVTQNKNSGKFSVCIYINKKRIPVGTFDDPKVGAIAHDKAIIQHNQDRSKLNFPDMYIKSGKGV
jgi:hypothetical protein